MNGLSKRIIPVILMISMVFGLVACNKSNENYYEESYLELFNTVTTIIGYNNNKDEFANHAQMLYDKLKEYHELYDIYHNYEGINNIKTINDNAGISSVKVDSKIIDLLKISKDAYKLTSGKINIAFGAVLRVWHQYRTEGLKDPDNAMLPPMDVLKERAQHTNINDLIIDEKESTVYLRDPQMSLDVGAIAKGYATEMVSEYATDIGFTNGTISVGGNVRTIGSKLVNNNKDGYWSVGIQNPDLESNNKNLYILNLKDCSLVTSGIYERYYTVNGKQYHHIIDPDTLMPSTYFLSVSIVCRDSGMADVLSTSVFNMPFKEGLKLIESLKNTQALWIFHDGTMKYSSGFEKLIRK